MEEKVLELIKKYNKIVIARHIGPDPDALGASFALKEILNENFPDKEILVVGSPVAKFKFFGMHDKVTEDMCLDALLITVDIPDIKRLDGVSLDWFKDVVKIDHHPEIDKFSDNELIDIDASSASELVARLCYKWNLKMPKKAADFVFIGMIADTNRFLFGANKSETYEIILKLIKDQHVKPNELYELLYKKSITEVRLEGFISLNMKVTENGLGYVKITNDDLRSFGLDSASVGSIMNNYNFIHGLICWVVFSEDVKNGVIRTSARSRGVKINKLFEQYNGGGHVYACGAKLHDFKEADEIIEKLDRLCAEYKEDEE